LLHRCIPKFCPDDDECDKSKSGILPSLVKVHDGDRSIVSSRIELYDVVVDVTSFSALDVVVERTIIVVVVVGGSRSRNK
jgi:hypothetical protein